MRLIPVYMPKYGMTMTEGVIVEWLRQEGDRVTAGEPLVTVETEKVDTDLEAPVSGILEEIVYQAEDEVPVGQVIAYIASDEGS